MSDNNNQKYINDLIELERQKFYGEVLIKIENGKITYMKKSETIKHK